MKTLQLMMGAIFLRPASFFRKKVTWAISGQSNAAQFMWRSFTTILSKKSMMIIILCSFLVLTSGPLLAQNEYALTIDQYMKAAVEVNGFNGSVLIAKKGEIIYHKSFGYKDEGQRQLLNNEHLFEIGVVTFGFTAEAIMILKEQGKLSLSDDVRKYFPQLPYEGITISELLSCTSGLPDYFFFMQPDWDSNRLATNSDMIKVLETKRTPLRSTPGSKWDWDITANVLLASVIEKISGQSFAAFMEQYFFKPLKMQSSRIYSDFPYAKANDTVFAQPMYADYVRGISLDTLQEPLQSLYAISYGMTGDAGINSTTADLYKWDRAIKENRLLPASLQHEMLTKRIVIDSSAHLYYGYGFKLGENELGKYILLQDPGAQRIGYSADMIRYLDDDISIIVLSNKSKEYSSTKLSGALAYILFNKEIILPYVHKRIDVAPEVLQKYTGKYALPTVFEFVVRNGKLYRLEENEPDEELIPESPTKFFINPDKTDVQFEFTTDANGNPVKAYIIIAGLKKEIKKL